MSQTLETVVATLATNEDAVAKELAAIKTELAAALAANTAPTAEQLSRLEAVTARVQTVSDALAALNTP